MKEKTKIKLPETIKSKLTHEQQERTGWYIAEASYESDPTPLNLYLGLFQVIPHKICLNYLDVEKAMEAFQKEYHKNIFDNIYSYQTIKDDGIVKSEVYKMNIFLKPDVLVHFDKREDEVTIHFKSTNNEDVEGYIQFLRNYETKFEEGNYLNIIVNSHDGLDTKRVSIENQEMNYELNYNDDLKEVHDLLVSKLNAKNEKGVVLLHGEPGTGKTTYIKSLIPHVKKEILLIPSKMAIDLTHPDFINLLLNNRNSILVIEDAEEILMKRSGANSSSVSALLNIADGMLSEILNIQIICTFNTELRNIDTAILRKGRMIARYEFKKLEQAKVQAIWNKLGIDKKAEGPLSHAETYNIEENTFQVSKNEIGFK